MMSAESNEHHALDVRVPTAGRREAPTDTEEEGDTVTPLPSAMGIAPSPTRSHSVPGATTPKYRLSRQSFRSALSFDSGISGPDMQRPPPPPSPGLEFAAEQDWARERDLFVPVEPSRIQIKPEIRPASIAESQPSKTAARCANERLDKYMVIRQRSFHGFARSKKELRTLPLTDPREAAPVAASAAEDTPSWLYRSKTDLYIEKRRAKLKSQRDGRVKSSKAVDLNGMTFGNLVDNLPSARHADYPKKSFRIPVGFSSTNPDITPRNSATSDSRLPLLSLNKMKQMMQNDIQTFKVPDGTTEEDMFKTSSLGVPRINSRGRGKLRKQPLNTVPLRIWEPSFDYVVVSNAKMISPRTESTSRTFPMTDTRQQPSPLK